MAKKKNGGPSAPVDPNARLVTTPESKVKSKKWFKRAWELGDKRQFDYAIEYYVNGLEFWPDAVEDACKALHGCAVARRQTGGKKPGFKDTMKRSMTDKNAAQAFMNSLWLFGHDPDNYAYIEGVAKNAARLQAEDTVAWAAGVCKKSLETNAKASAKQFHALAKMLEEMGDRAVARKETAFAVQAFELGVSVMDLWRRRVPKDNATELALRDLSTKLTITKGKYRDGDSFKESVADSEKQLDQHDQERTVQSEERIAELVAKAEKEYRANPDDASALRHLVDLLCRPEKESGEKQAMSVLIEHYKRGKDYRWKQTADDIRMRQLDRRVRHADPDDEEAFKRVQIASLKFDLAVFKERIERYPTDHRIKYEYGLRLFRAGRFDDAIPMFQAARVDPKSRTGCSSYLGRCFYRKAYYSQAISTLEAELANYERTEDDVAKEMLFWLGRAQQDNGEPEAARETFGKILQMDYNYKDVRDRLDRLPPAGG